MDSKLSLLSEFQEFFKRRGEVEYEYARQLERLCEKFEKSTKQRNIRCVPVHACDDISYPPTELVTSVAMPLQFHCWVLPPPHTAVHCVEACMFNKAPLHACQVALPWEGGRSQPALFNLILP